MENKNGNLFADWEIGIAKNVINQGSRRISWFREEDFDDYLQELLLHWWKVRDRYRPNEGAKRETYMGMVLRRKMYDLLEGQRTKKRWAGNFAESLEKPVLAGEKDRAIGDTRSDWTGKDVRPDHDEINLKIDLQTVLATLTPEQLRICHLRRQGYSEMATAKQMEIPRSTLQDKTRRIRTIFSDQGLEKYRR